MGRFYKTAQPSFIGDNMYKPPIELMKGLVGVVDERNDELVNKTDLLGDATQNISHLNNNSDNQLVEGIKQGYNEEIESLTKEIQNNPLEYQRLMPKVKHLQKRMNTDRVSGDWHNAEKRQADYMNWAEENKEYRKSDPDAFNRLSSAYLQDVSERSASDSSAQFQGENIVESPYGTKESLDILEGMKAKISSNSDGTYNYENKNLTAEELAEVYWGLLQNTPRMGAYMRQRGGVLGEQGYYDEGGTFIQPFMYNEDGGKTLNPNSRVARELAPIASAFSQSERTLDENKFALNDQNIQGRKDAAELLSKNRLKRDAKKVALKSKAAAKTDSDKLIAKLTYDCAKSEDKNSASCRSLRGMQRGTTPLAVKSKATITPEEDRKYMDAHPEAVNSIESQRHDIIYEKVNKEFQGEKLQTPWGQGEEIDFGDYTDFLNGKKSTEADIKEYLKTQRKDIVDYGLDWVLDNAMSAPDFTKTNWGVTVSDFYDLGEEYNEKINESYEDLVGVVTNTMAQPINDPAVESNIIGEILENPTSFTIYDKNGGVLDKDVLDSVEYGSRVDIVENTGLGERGARMFVPGPDGDPISILVYPNSSNMEQSSILRFNSLMGVDKDSQSAKEGAIDGYNKLLVDFKSVSREGNTLIEQVGDKRLHLTKRGDVLLVQDMDNEDEEPFEITLMDYQKYKNTLK